MYVMVDHYDSYVYNLVSDFQSLGAEVKPVRSDCIDFESLKRLDRQKELQGLILSPGPGSPEECVKSVELVRRFTGRVPILGVCLGHQIICHAFGGRIIKGSRPMHGKLTPVRHRQEELFAGLPQDFLVTRYHSLTADKAGLPETLRVDAVSPDREVMAVSHRSEPVWGVQFHPEAVLTEYGPELLANYMRLCERWRA